MNARDYVIRAEWTARVATADYREGDLAAAAAGWQVVADFYAQAAAAAATEAETKSAKSAKEDR